MSGLYFLVPTLAAIVISMLIVRAGAIALLMTGMNFEKAKFQALSAFSGTGFTTREAEGVVNNPLRRRIVTWLMVFGNVGIVTVIVTATSSFSSAEGLGIGLNFLVLIVGLGVIFAIARHAPLVKRWELFSRQRLSQLKIFDDETPVDELLHISEGYGIVRMQLLDSSPFIDQIVSDINSGLEHSIVLGIERGKEWLPTPRSSLKLVENDSLVIYGRLEELKDHFG